MDYTHSLSLLPAGLTSIHTLEEAASWAAASEAGLRLLPLLSRLAAKPRLFEEAARRLSRLLIDDLSSSTTAPDAPAPLEELCPLQLLCQLQQLCQLSNTSCRVVHWLAAGSSRLPLLRHGAASDWFELQEALSAQLMSAMRLHEAMPEEDRWGAVPLIPAALPRCVVLCMQVLDMLGSASNLFTLAFA